MKLQSFLCVLAAAGAVAAGFAFPFALAAASLVATSASAFLCCIALSDYARRKRYAPAYDAQGSRERLPLAA